MTPRMTKKCSLEDLLDEFHSSVNQRLALRTADLYKSDIGFLLEKDEFPKGFRTPKDYEALVKIIDRRVKAMNRSKKYKDSTKMRRKCSANVFFDFLNEKVEIEVPKYLNLGIAQKPVRTLTAAEFNKLMRAILRKPYTCARDRVMYTLIFETGIYQKEIAGMRYSDFVRKNGKITALKVAYGKGKSRTIELSKRAVGELKNYEALCQAAHLIKIPLNRKGVSYFRNTYGRAINERSVRRNFQSYVRKADFKNLFLSSLRYSYIERWGGDDPSVLAESLGLTTFRVKTIQGCLPKN